eukprot:343487_1
MKCRRFALLFSLVFMVVLDTGHATNKNYDFQKSDNSLTQNEVYDADINMDSQTQGTLSANVSDDDDDDEIDMKPSSTVLSSARGRENEDIDLAYPDNTLSEQPRKKRRLNVSAESDDLKDVFTSSAARFISDAVDTDEHSGDGDFITTDDDALTDVSIHNVMGPKAFNDGGDLELDRTPFADAKKMEVLTSGYAREQLKNNADFFETIPTDVQKLASSFIYQPGSLSVSLGTHLKYLHHPYYDDLTSFLRGCSRFSGIAEILYLHELKTSPSAEFSWVEAEISKHPSTILSVKSKNFMFPWKLTHKPRGPQNIKLPMTLTKLIITAEYGPGNNPSDSVIATLNSMQCDWNMNQKFTLDIVYGLKGDTYNSSGEPLEMITIQHVGQTVIFEFGVSFVHSLYRREQADYF